MSHIRKHYTARAFGTGRRVSEARRKRFVDAYIANGQNGRQAAIAIGVRPEQADAFSQYQLHKDERTMQMVKERVEELAKPYALTAQEVIASLARALRFDPRKLYHADGTLKSIDELDDDTALELAGHETEVVRRRGARREEDEEVQVTKVKYPNKATARDQGMKHFGLYAKDNAQRATDPEEVAAKIREKLAQIDGSTSTKKES